LVCVLLKGIYLTKDDYGAKHMKVLIIDDHDVFRKSFILLLKSITLENILSVEATNGNEGLLALEKSDFDLIFLDVVMPKMNGIDACKKITKLYSKIPIIILTKCYNESLIFYFFELGVHSFLTKENSIDQLKIAIENAIAGRKYFPEPINDLIRKRRNDKSQLIQTVEFTLQEKRLISFLQKGHSSKMIAHLMGLSVKTIDTYRERLLLKTQTNNVAGLISFGYETGILF
jgi:two-component system response regulator NreC